MINCNDLSTLRQTLSSFSGRTVGFVPTMGALHEGHASLIRRCKDECDVVVVSIFVNPLQFGPSEDFDRYPRFPDRDMDFLHTLNVDVLFMPTCDMMYPYGLEDATQVVIPELSKKYCGKTRPHFFAGVLSVVNRLFHLIRPTSAYFGEKDYQQLVLIRQMVRDLFMDITIVGCPIIREADGLAMSSRNQYLSDTERVVAAMIPLALSTGSLEGARDILDKASDIRIDYLDVFDDRLLFAGYVGTTRLIDNVCLKN
jgi:pantoate--beta-alanine ligase